MAWICEVGLHKAFVTVFFKYKMHYGKKDVLKVEYNDPHNMPRYCVFLLFFCKLITNAFQRPTRPIEKDSAMDET